MSIQPPRGLWLQLTDSEILESQSAQISAGLHKSSHWQTRQGKRLLGFWVCSILVAILLCWHSTSSWYAVSSSTAAVLPFMALEQNFWHPRTRICSEDFHIENCRHSKPRLLGEATEAFSYVRCLFSVVGNATSCYTCGRSCTEKSATTSEWVFSRGLELGSKLLSPPCGRVHQPTTALHQSFMLLWDLHGTATFELPLPVQINEIKAFRLYKQKLTCSFVWSCALPIGPLLGATLLQIPTRF